eukprot:15442355-Alexandrium_andersonii.AAC.1
MRNHTAEPDTQSFTSGPGRQQQSVELEATAIDSSTLARDQAAALGGTGPMSQRAPLSSLSKTEALEELEE